MPQDRYASVAAELADRYIELILSTQPELLVADLTDADADDIAAQAEKLAQYRHALIQQLQDQPLADVDMDDDYDSDSD